MEEPTLKEKQCAWAVAWQDHGDQKALLALIESVNGFAVAFVDRYARTPDHREEFFAECRAAAVEAAEKFDRARPFGFSTLCYDVMNEHVKRAARRSYSPVTGSSFKRIAGVHAMPLVDDFDEEVGGGVSVAADAVEPFTDQGPAMLWELLENAELTDLERLVLMRHTTGKTLRALADEMGFSATWALKLERRARAKVLAVAAKRGLELRDLL